VFQIFFVNPVRQPSSSTRFVNSVRQFRGKYEFTVLSAHYSTG